MSWCRFGALGLATIAVLTTPAAVAATPCDEVQTAQAPSVEASERIRIHEVAGRKVVVLLPHRYSLTTDRYPVLYLFHGGGLSPDHIFATMPVEDFTASLPAGREAVVVVPDGTALPAWANWRSGVRKDETTFLDEIIPLVDGSYRTIPDRSHRAVAGISAGGFGALRLAARHPDLFSVVGGIEASADISDRQASYTAVYSLAQAIGGSGACYGGGITGVFGDPVTDQVWWRNASPPDLAVNYSGVDVHLLTGDDLPCDGDVQDAATGWHTTQNLIVKPSNDTLDAALTAAAVPHTYDVRCGFHSTKAWMEMLADFWGDMFDAFGRPVPASFDYRTVDPEFDVWGWRFRTDPGRAPEFLTVADASAHGVALTGSGRVEITTAPLFPPGTPVALTGATQTSVTSGPDGRITFDVSLGPAHEHQQYGPVARALEAGGGYFTSRIVRFRPAETSPACPDND